MCESTIKRREFSAVTERDSEQMCVGDLTVTDKFLLIHEIAGGNRKIVLPEDVIR